MRRLFAAIIGSVVCAAIASPSVLASSGLTVGLAEGPGRAPEVLPGDTYAQTVTVAAGDTSADVLIEVLSYREDAGTGIVPLTSAEDDGPYSARSFITPATTSVHLSSGETKQIDLSVSIPEDVSDGGRYALLRFSTAPQGRGTVGVASAIVLPFKFTIKGSHLIHTGKITGLKVQNTETGKPLPVVITYENTGNHHYKTVGEVKIVGANGTTMGTAPISLASPIPGSSAQISADLVPTVDMPVGSYLAIATLKLDDGTAIDSATAAFQISSIYVPPSAAPTPESGPTTSPRSSRLFDKDWIITGGLIMAALTLGFLTATVLRRWRSHHE